MAANIAGRTRNKYLRRKTYRQSVADAGAYAVASMPRVIHADDYLGSI
jgi:hypothetical protein